MNHARRIRPALLAVLLAVPGCLVLSGQRITVHHDAAADRLELLLHYDGIFDDPQQSGRLFETAPPTAEERAERSRERLERFVAGGELMLLDWYGVVEPDRIANEVERSRPAMAALCQRWLASVEVEVLGHYRDAEGRIGAAQLVTIDGVSALLTLANRALDEAVLAEEPAAGADEPGEPGAAATWRRWRSAAFDGHRWLALDGHSLVARIPVQDEAWRAIKANAVRDLLADLIERMGADRADGDAALATIADGLAAAPLSWVQSPGMVEVRLGFAAAPATIELPLHPGYDESAAAEVVRVAPARLDEALGRALLAEPAGESRGVRALAAWGPEADRVRAVAGLLDGPDAEAAWAWLRRFAEAWAAAGRWPEPPSDRRSADAWRAWLRQVRPGG